MGQNSQDAPRAGTARLLAAWAWVRQPFAEPLCERARVPCTQTEELGAIAPTALRSESC